MTLSAALAIYAIIWAVFAPLAMGTFAWIARSRG